MAESITLSLDTYNKLVDALNASRTENQKIRRVLEILNARLMRKHMNTLSEYDAYFSPRTTASLDRHTSEIEQKHLASSSRRLVSMDSRSTRRTSFSR